MRRGTTIYLYELAEILPSVAIPVGMPAALMVTAFGAGIQLMGDEGRNDPTNRRRLCRLTNPASSKSLVINLPMKIPGAVDPRLTLVEAATWLIALNLYRTYDAWPSQHPDGWTH
jgi:hypothetical protein